MIEDLERGALCTKSVHSYCFFFFFGMFFVQLPRKKKESNVGFFFLIFVTLCNQKYDPNRGS